jgi:threonylcarbamoyladenosine tRNA methylthiotransferase MtaB
VKKAGIATLGCKVNQVESVSIKEQLMSLGYELVDFRSPANLYIINTCTVTNRTDYKSRNLIRQALERKKKNPDILVIVTGCYAQKNQQEVNSLGCIDLIVDNLSKIDVKSWLNNSAYTAKDINSEYVMPWSVISNRHERSRAFIKVQDGCDYYCSYCAVPYGRGKPRSYPFDKIKEQAQVLIDQGYKELVLTGVNLGLYHDKDKNKKLHDVINYLAMQDSNLLIRLSSIEPDLWSEELFNVIKHHTNVCPHFHIPVQSGSDRVLSSMGRKYSSEKVIELIGKLKQIKPECAIGIDMICGFPGETDIDFEQSMALCQQNEITYIHVFGYSRRKGTPAASFNNQTHGSVIDKRVKDAIILSEKLTENYKNLLIRKQVSLRGIVERIKKTTQSALSDHYIRMYMMQDRTPQGEIIHGRCNAIFEDGIMVV